MLRWLMVGLIVLALGACGSGGDAARTTLPVDLRERAFLSESVEGRQLVPGTQIRLTFGETELSANAGCNHMFGEYRIEGDMLKMDGLGSTEMGCDGGLHAQDKWLAELLTGSPTVTVDEPRITLSAGGVRLTLLDRKIASPDRPLVGTRWIGNGSGTGGETGAITFGPGSDQVSVTFGSDGRVAIFTACQRGEGRFKADGRTIAFSELSYDGAACADPSYEQASRDVLRVLDGLPVVYEIREGSLTLERGDRLLMLRVAE